MELFDSSKHQPKTLWIGTILPIFAWCLSNYLKHVWIGLENAKVTLFGLNQIGEIGWKLFEC